MKLIRTVSMAVTILLGMLLWPVANIASTGSTAVDGIRVTDIGGKAQTLPSPGSAATVVFFITHDCPMCNRFAPEINKITADYKDKRVAFFVAYVESDLSPSGARQHAASYRFRCSLLRDAKHGLANRLGAKVTPETVVLDQAGTVMYRGRIDDRFISFGMVRPQPTVRDLRDALDAVLQGKPVANVEEPALGCSIPTD